MLVIKPKENDLVLFDKPLYHAITEVRNRGVIKNRISFMFSSWDYVPKIYEKHEHWSNYSPYIDKHPPKPMEFNLI